MLDILYIVLIYPRYPEFIYVEIYPRYPVYSAIYSAVYSADIS